MIETCPTNQRTRGKVTGGVESGQSIIVQRFVCLWALPFSFLLSVLLVVGPGAKYTYNFLAIAFSLWKRNSFSSEMKCT